MLNHRGEKKRIIEYRDDYRMKANKNYIASRSETALEDWFRYHLHHAIEEFWTLSEKERLQRMKMEPEDDTIRTESH